MPEIYVISPRPQGGGVWPFLRGVLAWVGFVVVVGGSVSVIRHWPAVHVIEAKAFVDPFAGETVPPVPHLRDIPDIPDTAAGPVSEPLPNTAIGLESGAPFICSLGPDGTPHDCEALD
jgi:hypothetical protein